MLNIQTETALYRLQKALDQAEAVLIGAGSGLSSSAGFVYDGERFERYFADFEKQYGFHDMYAGGFYPFKTPEERWAYWSRFILINRYMDPPKPVYQELRKLVEKKDYFVLTTNVDHCFQKAGLKKERLFYTQGDYGLWQCSKPCCTETYDNEDAVRQMVTRQSDMRIPSELIPHCPRCGAPMAMNLRADDTFVQDQGWYAAAERYEAFVQRHQNQAVLYLELGVGLNTPGIIKYNFWQQVYQNPRSLYACINGGQAYAPKEIAGRSICLKMDIGEALQKLNLES